MRWLSFETARFVPALILATVLAAACSGNADLGASADPFGTASDFEEQSDLNSVGGGASVGLSDSSRTAEASDGLGQPGSVDAQTGGSPVAYVEIEHARRVNAESSQALAHFTRQGLASQDKLTVVASLTGSTSLLPRAGRCIDPSASPQPPPSSRAPVELLEAGSVTIHATPQATHSGAEAQADDAPSETVEAEALGAAADNPARSEALVVPVSALNGATSGPVVISLAPRAFPNVSGVASGVVYTSRDRLTSLPAQATYQVDIDGGNEVPAMTLYGDAPSHLGNVTLSGVPLEQVSVLSRGMPIDVTWDVGAAGDFVFVELVSRKDSRVVLRCSYADDAGSGTVPWLAAVADRLDPDEARISVHRFRKVTTHQSTSRGELSFDFELSQDVRFE